MTTSTLVRRLACLCVLSIAPLASVASAAPALTLHGVAQSGMGCWSGSSETRSHILRDNRLVVPFFKFDLYDGGMRYSRSNCSIVVDLEAPAGYTYVLSDVSVRGNSRLRSGTAATINASAYEQGDNAATYKSLVVRGPDSQDLDLATGLTLEASCAQQRQLVVQISANITSRSSNGQSWITLDDAVLQFDVVPCN